MTSTAASSSLLSSSSSFSSSSSSSIRFIENVHCFLESHNVRRTCSLLLHGPRLCRRPAAETFELPQLMESLLLLRTCTGTLNRVSPQVSLSRRERAGVRGKGSSASPTFTKQPGTSSNPQLMESLLLRACTVTANRLRILL
jgi:hypothetical protein